MFLATQAALLASERPLIVLLVRRTTNIIVFLTPAQLPVPPNNTKMTQQLPIPVKLVTQPALLAMEELQQTVFPAQMVQILSLHHQEVARHPALHITMAILQVISVWDVMLLVLLVLELWRPLVRLVIPIFIFMERPA